MADPLKDPNLIKILHETTKLDYEALPSANTIDPFLRRREIWARSDRFCMGLENIGRILARLSWAGLGEEIIYVQPNRGLFAIRLRDDKDGQESIKLDQRTQDLIKATAIASKRAYEDVAGNISWATLTAGIIFTIMVPQVPIGFSIITPLATKILIDDVVAAESKNIGDAAIDLQGYILNDTYAIKSVTKIKRPPNLSYVRIDYAVQSARGLYFVERCYYAQQTDK